MSRCFPFPPPGYEKKIRTEEADSLIKEKHKEKKHKKEKKDKERKEGKEGKEKKEKETSKDKHKERKEKKEKRKDRKDKDRDREKTRTSEDKKSAGVLPNTGDKEKLNNGNGESKFIQDLARRIRDEEEATESQSSHDYLTKSKISCPVTQTNHTKVDEKSINTHKNSALERRPESAVLRVSSSMDQKGAEVTVKPLEKKDQTKIKELQEKNHRRENVAKSDKSLDRSEPKNITDRSSKEKKEEKTEVINKTVQEKQKFLEGRPRLKEKGNDSVDARIFGVQDLSRAGVKNLTAEVVPGKRKDLKTNGFLYENGSRPNKIQRPNASPISSVENGRKLGASQTHPKPISELQGTVCNPEVKEQRINGFIYPQEPKSHPPVSSVKVKENSETSAKKRPHSDLKYLDQILTVPKREELHEVDDYQQEWLFGQSGVKLLKKQRADSATSLVETPQVWNQALRIESTDIVALPYVVPF
ncbi:hypothetical protein V5N11_023924 [Cardamine amara subsp. amara]|uniref:Myb-like protein X n=1 Tax=Cardamine amara subsp. amara TaxID=228776 RepID=A0ABD1B5B2_CARAN